MKEIIAAIDVETTGLDPRHHGIIELAIQPLDADFNISKDIKPFVGRIKARWPERADAKALEVNGP